MLLAEIKKLDEGEKFVQLFNAAFDGIEKDDDEDASGITSLCRSPTRATDTEVEPISSDDFITYRLPPLAGGTKLTKVHFISAREETEKSGRYKIKFDAALKVFNLFQLTCRVENSSVEECPEFFSTSSSSTLSTTSDSTKNVKFLVFYFQWWAVRFISDKYTLQTFMVMEPLW